MYKILKDFNLSHNFKISEFTNVDCNNSAIIVPEFWDNIQMFRDMVDKPVNITKHGGFRTVEYNRKQGREYLSDHEFGCAVDGYIVGMNSNEVFDFIKRNKLLGKHCFTSIGLYDTFIHLGCRHLWQSKEQFKPANGLYYFWDERTKK